MSTLKIQLSGPPGSGKSRMARRIAYEFRFMFNDTYACITDNSVEDFTELGNPKALHRCEIVVSQTQKEVHDP